MTIEFNWRKEDALFLTPSIVYFSDSDSKHVIFSFIYFTALVSINK
jgi:hypothetical protein